MCEYCNPESDRNKIWQDGASSDWYLDIQTSKWDPYDDDYVHQKIFINYCPYCGRNLYKGKNNE